MYKYLNLEKVARDERKLGIPSFGQTVLSGTLGLGAAGATYRSGLRYADDVLGDALGVHSTKYNPLTRSDASVDGLKRRLGLLGDMVRERGYRHPLKFVKGHHEDALRRVSALGVAPDVVDAMRRGINIRRGALPLAVGGGVAGLGLGLSALRNR